MDSLRDNIHIGCTEFRDYGFARRFIQVALREAKAEVANHLRHMLLYNGLSPTLARARICAHFVDFVGQSTLWQRLDPETKYTGSTRQELTVISGVFLAIVLHDLVIDGIDDEDVILDVVTQDNMVYENGVVGMVARQVVPLLGVGVEGNNARSGPYYYRKLKPAGEYEDLTR